MIRIVKLTILSSETDTFKTFFKEHHATITSFEGCNSVKLVQSIDNPCIFFTISDWNGPEYLEKYRTSNTFKEIWAFAKSLFADNAEAWSTEEF
jgi:quinol monooxygenase YgiN